jgi:hypothetical protein
VSRPKSAVARKTKKTPRHPKPGKRRPKTAKARKGDTASAIANAKSVLYDKTSDDAQLAALEAEIQRLREARANIESTNNSLATPGNRLASTLSTADTQSFFPVHYQSKTPKMPTRHNASARPKKGINPDDEEQVLTYLHKLKREHQQNLEQLQDLYDDAVDDDEAGVTQFGRAQSRTDGGDPFEGVESFEDQATRSRRMASQDMTLREMKAVAWDNNDDKAQATASRDHKYDPNELSVKEKKDHHAWADDEDVMHAMNAEELATQKKKRKKIIEMNKTVKTDSELLRSVKYKQVTVPKPFGFEAREAKNRATRGASASVLEYLKQKEDEERILTTQIKARPIPSSSLVPKYEHMVERARQRSEDIKLRSKQVSLSNIEPFTFQASKDVAARHAARKAEIDKAKKKQANAEDYQFRASEIPMEVKVNMLDTMFVKQEKKRAREHSKRSEELLKSAKLPPRCVAVCSVV